jgi:hypothetical protein
MTSLRLAVALGLALDVSGALHVYGIHDALGSTRENIMATILLIIAALWLTARPTTSSNQDELDASWVAFLIPLAFVLSISDIFSFVQEGWSTTRVVTFGGGTITLLLLALRRAPTALITALAFALGVGLRSIHIKYIPIEPSRGDMLPLVQQALTNLLAGQSPYTTYQMPWEVPLTYLPLTWLAYAPAFLADWDVRWINVVAELAILGAAVFTARRMPTRRVRADAPMLIWAWLFLSPTIIRWDMVTSAPIGWAALAWALALVVTRHRLAPLTLGIAAATTPLIVVFAPFIAACWWREEGWKALVRKGISAGVVAGVLLLPWYVWSPTQFLDGSFRWFNDLSRFPTEKWEAEHTWVDITGYAGEFWARGWEDWLKPVQLALVLAVTALYARHHAKRMDLLRYATAAFILFMLFNPVLWPYLYNPALIAALLATAVPRTNLVIPSHLKAQS